MKVKEMLIKVSKPFCSEKQDANGDSEMPNFNRKYYDFNIIKKYIDSCWSQQENKNKETTKKRIPQIKFNY